MLLLWTVAINRALVAEDDVLRELSSACKETAGNLVGQLELPKVGQGKHRDGTETPRDCVKNRESENWVKTLKSCREQVVTRTPVLCL